MIRDLLEKVLGHRATTMIFVALGLVANIPGLPAWAKTLLGVVGVVGAGVSAGVVTK